MQTAFHHNRHELCPAEAAFPSPLPGRRTLACLGLLALLFLASATAHAQVSIFMRIGGPAGTIGTTQSAPLLPGSSVDAQYPQWISVLSMQHGVGLPVSLSGGTFSVGTPSMSEVTITKTMDLSSPSLELLACGSASGLPVSLPIDYVTLDFRLGGTTPQVFYRLELQQVYITGYSVSSGTSATPSESLSLNFARIRWTYVPYTSGKAGSPITKGWDLTKNAAF